MANRGNAKEIMLNWCKAMTRDYTGVNVQNFGSSWADGLAFCALIHHFYPDAFDFSELKAEKKRENFTLAFETAQKLGNITPLLEVDDMLRFKVPDWKCVFCQIQLYYKAFHLEQGKSCHQPPQNLSKLPPTAASPTEASS